MSHNLEKFHFRDLRIEEATKKGIVSKTRRSCSQAIEKIIWQYEQSALEEISFAQSRQRMKEKE